MARKVTILRVFAASPTDVAEERAALEEIVRELNLTWGNNIGLSLDLVKWETHAYPGIGSDAQAVINEQIADDYDIFVGIMWTRFGTPTGRAGSGTAEEFERAYSRFKSDPNQIRIMFYFNDAPVPPSQLDPEQLSLVQKFRGELGQKGDLYWTYTTREEFSQLLRIHLSRQVQAWGKSWGMESQKERQEVSQPEVLENIVTEDLELEEEGFLDLLEIGQEKFELLNGGASRMATALQQLGERVQEASEEINRGKSPSGSIEIKQAKRISNRVAEEMESFAKLMEVEVPNFANAYSAAIDAYSRAVSIEHEMGAEGRQENVEKAKNSIRDFKTVLASSQSTMSSFRQIVAAMPRATSLLNRSKKRVIAILDRLEQELATALNLTGEIERVMSQHPDISGVWEEIPGINVIVVQDDGHFKAEASYLQNGSTVKWEMRGTITKEGAIEGVLAHTQPAGFASQTRRAKLAEDCKTIKGYAEFHGGGGHEWTWTKLYVKREH